MQNQSSPLATLTAPTLSVDTPAPNVIRIDTATGAVLYSYGTPVAVFSPGRGWCKTTQYHSRTTSKHVTQHTTDAKPVSPADFAKLVAELK